MKAYLGMLLFVAAVMLAPSMAIAACPTGAFGPVIFTRVEIASNPLVSGQNGGVLFQFMNTSAIAPQTVLLQVDVADEQHNVLVPNVIRAASLVQTRATNLRIDPFSTAGAVFSGYVHATVSVGGICNDFVALRLVILPPCPCPAALPAPIPPYILVP